MNRLLKATAARVLSRTPLGLLPVTVRHGIAAGARWTLFPYSSYWRGTHEPELQSVLLNLGQGNIRGWTCWDLGAHFGLYSIGLARRVGPEGQVAAFEPNPLSHARLARHHRANAVPWLKIYNAAVSDQAGSAELYTYGDIGATSTHLPYDGETRTADVGAINVRTLRLDDLVKSGELRAPQFVKIDVEGHGHHALAGMRTSLATARPILIAGFHSQSELDGMMALISPLNYAARKIGAVGNASEVTVGGDYLFTPRG